MAQTQRRKPIKTGEPDVKPFSEMTEAERQAAAQELAILLTELAVLAAAVARTHQEQ